MRSMTGYGVGDVALSRGRVIAEMRSVNGRALDVRVRLPEALGDLTLWAEQLVRRKLRRGRVEATVRTEGCLSAPVEIDVLRAESALAALSALAGRIEPSAPVPLSLLGAVPGLFVPRGKDVEELRRASQEAIEFALTDLERARLREGEATRRDLTLRLEALQAAHRRLKERAAEVPRITRDRLTERLARLDVESLDPGRLEAEVALLAQRSDVSEELARLETHFTHFSAIVDGKHEDATLTGRHLDFLLQEMSREIATLGAKAQDGAISRDVVVMRAELERMREQVQNVE
jgi:uncharacterized protein (TIGR00255 family)